MELKITIPDEMRQRYLERRAKDIEALSEAIQNKNFSVFQHIGHQIKGNALTYGYMDLEQLGKQIENAGKAQNGQLATEVVEDFKAWLNKYKH